MPKGCAFSAKAKWELREADTHLGQRPCGRANRPNTNPQPTGQFRLKSALDPGGRSLIAARLSRPECCLPGSRFSPRSAELPQHLVRSGSAGIARSTTGLRVIACPRPRPRNCLHPRPGATRLSCMPTIISTPYAGTGCEGQRNGSPDRQTLCRRTANLRAKATRALPGPERCSMALAQAFRCSGRFTR